MANSIEELQRLAGMQAGMAPEPGSPDQERIDRAVIGHRDNEKDMLKKELLHSGSYSIELYKMLDSLPDDADFPHWWQGKIIEAVRLLDSAKHYLEGELATMPPAVEPPVDEIEGLSESAADTQAGENLLVKLMKLGAKQLARLLSTAVSPEEAAEVLEAMRKNGDLKEGVGSSIIKVIKSVGAKAADIGKKLLAGLGAVTAGAIGGLLTYVGLSKFIPIALGALKVGPAGGIAIALLLIVLSLAGAAKAASAIGNWTYEKLVPIIEGAFDELEYMISGNKDDEADAPANAEEPNQDSQLAEMRKIAGLS